MWIIEGNQMEVIQNNDFDNNIDNGNVINITNDNNSDNKYNSHIYHNDINQTASTLAATTTITKRHNYNYFRYHYRIMSIRIMVIKK